MSVAQMKPTSSRATAVLVQPDLSAVRKCDARGVPKRTIQIGEPLLGMLDRSKAVVEHLIDRVLEDETP